MTEADFTHEESASKYKEHPVDELSKKSAQLHAMLTSVFGSGYQSFNGYNDTIKENFLWACADLAQDIHNLSGQMKM